MYVTTPAFCACGRHCEMMKTLFLISKVSFLSQALCTVRKQWIDVSMNEKASLQMSRHSILFCLFLSLRTSIFSDFSMKCLIWTPKSLLERRRLWKIVLELPDTHFTLWTHRYFSCWVGGEMNCSLYFWVTVPRTADLRSSLEPQKTLDQQEIVFCCIKSLIFEGFVVIIDLPFSPD